ncbi:MAG: tetratricopeptide repeat protein [Armatimonadetes bacterium]|nr:tetratricopeptide repeat protein [Armatimonadota bacterium]
MLNCQQCSAPNKLNSKFCCQCGWPISEAENRAYSQDLDAKVAEAQRLFGENKLRDAMMVAESVLTGDPDNISALALKGDCLEREGDIAGALECYEHVVTLKPDSPLDRIRVAHLRRLDSAQPLTMEDKPDRRNTVFAAVATVVMLAATGSALVLANQNVKVASEPKKKEAEVVSRPFLTPAPVPTQSDKDTAAKSATRSSETGTSKAEQPESGDETERPSTGIDRGRTSNHPARGIDPVGDQLARAANDSGFQPVSPEVTVVQDNTPKTDGDPAPVAEDSGPKPSETHATARPPVIDIRPSAGSSNTNTVNGSKPHENNGNEGKTLIQVAREYFLAGEYDKAAKSYERALKLGASPASANHRLAQCYVNLNRRSEALSAYKRALAAYQSMLDQGVGDKRLVESYMAECRQFIKMLQ